MSKELMIGWSEVDITPNGTTPVALHGQYYPRTATGIHSPLKNTVVAISSGDEYFITGSLDNIGCPRQFHDAVRRKVAELDSSIDPERIFLSGIHTHNAPSLAFSSEDKQVWQIAEPGTLTPEEYAEMVIPLVAENIVNAWQNRQIGGIIRGFGQARIGHCRRAVYNNSLAEMYGDTTRADFTGMEAGEDSGVEMLFTCDPAGNRTGVILNVACPSQVMEATYQISSDFAGAVREQLKETYGSNFCTIYQISPAGCQSPRDLVRHYQGQEPDFWHADGVSEMANRLCHAVNTAKMEAPEYAPKVQYISCPVTLPRRRASYRDFQNAQSELTRLLEICSEADAYTDFCNEVKRNEAIGGPGPYDSKLHHFVQIKNAQAVIARYEDQDKKPNLQFEMNVARLGDAVFANSPFELYLYYGQNIKARSRAKQTFLIELGPDADVESGYLPSPAAEQFGGYGGCIINGQVGSDGGFLLADITVKTINELFES